ncbi:hypothetical protein [Streptomyces prunicolor]|uniref:hypothetical protein n=1 Tax=Streptomyces prunicolor TaxID=67348 RepID=UPI00038137E3|nr:hypothetical protein [Streptomyces prunicolor]
MATQSTATSPSVAIARALRRLGLDQGRGGDFRVTGEYRNGERICTYVVTLTQHADETIAEHADDVERWVSEDGGWAVRVSIRYCDDKPRPWVDVSNGPGERIRETPPAAPAVLEEAAQPEPVEDAAPPVAAPPTPAAPQDLDPKERRLQEAQAFALGWSPGQAELAVSAAAGQLRIDPDGSLRHVPVPGRAGQRLADYRLKPLVQAGFVVVGALDVLGRRPVNVTADGRRAVTVWKRVQPKPVPKNRKEELFDRLQPLIGGEEAVRRAKALREEEARRRADRDRFYAVLDELHAWEERDERLSDVWAGVQGMTYRLGRRRPAGWVPTEEEIAEHHLAPDVVAELRADAANPQPRPELPSVRCNPPEELPPLDANTEAPEQLDLFGASPAVAGTWPAAGHVCDEAEERAAYGRYVSDGLADTDGWFSPMDFEAWQAHHHRAIGYQEPRKAACTDTECNAPRHERTRCLNTGTRRKPRYESLCVSCYEPRAAVIVAAERARRAPQQLAV